MKTKLIDGARYRVTNTNCILISERSPEIILRWRLNPVTGEMQWYYEYEGDLQGWNPAETWERSLELIEDDAVPESRLEIEVGDTLIIGTLRIKVIANLNDGREFQLDCWPGSSSDYVTICRAATELYGWLATGAMTLEKKREPRVFTWVIESDGVSSLKAIPDVIGIGIHTQNPLYRVPCEITITMKEIIQP